MFAGTLSHTMQLATYMISGRMQPVYRLAGADPAKVTGTGSPTRMQLSQGTRESRVSSEMSRRAERSCVRERVWRKNYARRSSGREECALRVTQGLPYSTICPLPLQHISSQGDLPSDATTQCSVRLCVCFSCQLLSIRIFVRRKRSNLEARPLSLREGLSAASCQAAHSVG